MPAVLHTVHDRFDEVGFQTYSDLGRRLDQHAAQLVRPHRSDQDGGLLRERHERFDVGEPAVEVAAQHQDQPSVAILDVVDKSADQRFAGLRVAGGEELLRLVEHQQVRPPPVVLNRLADGRRADVDAPGGRTRQCAGAKRRQKSGPHEGGLANAARAGHHDDRLLGEPAGQHRYQPLAPDEQRRVLLPVPGEPQVRTPVERPDRDRLARCLGQQFRFLPQQAIFQIPKSGTGIDAQVLGQHLPGAPTRTERVRLTPGPVQRQRQLLPTPLTVGLGANA